MIDHRSGGKNLEDQQLEPSEVAQLIVEVASEKLAADIVMLDLRGLASFTDYFVVMSADSSRLIEALEEDIVTTLKQSKLSIHRREGTAASGWVLMDCSDVIVGQGALRGELIFEGIIAGVSALEQRLESGNDFRFPV